MKNVYYQFLTTNINLFLNAYINRDYNQLHKSFYTVSVAITVQDVIKSHIYPFVLYGLDYLQLTWNCCCFFKSNWHKYKAEKRNKLMKRWTTQFSGSDLTQPDWDESHEKLTYKEFNKICQEESRHRSRGQLLTLDDRRHRNYWGNKVLLTLQTWKIRSTSRNRFREP